MGLGNIDGALEFPEQLDLYGIEVLELAQQLIVERVDGHLKIDLVHVRLDFHLLYRIFCKPTTIMMEEVGSERKEG